METVLDECLGHSAWHGLHHGSHIQNLIDRKVWQWRSYDGPSNARYLASRQKKTANPWNGRCTLWGAIPQISSKSISVIRTTVPFSARSPSSSSFLKSF